MDMKASAVRESQNDWVMCSRVDGPPLRFKGRAVTRHESPSGDETPLFVALWQRQSGGYTVAFSSWTKTGWRPDAVKLDNLEDAICEIEAVCADLQTLATDPPAATGGALEHLQTLARHAHDVSTLRVLAGHALSDWVDLTTPA